MKIKKTPPRYAHVTLLKDPGVYSHWKLVYVSYICYQFFFEMMWFSFFFTKSGYTLGIQSPFENGNGT